MMWLALKVSVLKTKRVKTAKTSRVITSWITFNCMRLKGPPFSRNPILLAGTWKMYSNRAIPQLIRMMETSPSLLNHFHSWNFKCPYQANTIKELLKINSPMVRIAFIVGKELIRWFDVFFLPDQISDIFPKFGPIRHPFFKGCQTKICGVGLARFFPTVPL